MSIQAKSCRDLKNAGSRVFAEDDTVLRGLVGSFKVIHTDLAIVRRFKDDMAMFSSDDDCVSLDFARQAALPVELDATSGRECIFVPDHENVR